MLWILGGGSALALIGWVGLRLLTGGIAHDFNNMLAVVLGGIELAKRNLPDGADAALRHIDNAAEGANRAAALTRQLLGFARSEESFTSKELTWDELQSAYRVMGLEIDDLYIDKNMNLEAFSRRWLARMKNDSSAFFAG